MQRALSALAAGAILFAISSFLVRAVCQDANPAQQPSPQQGSPQPHRRRPMPKPTNLQVLPKGIAVPDLLAMMRSFTGALGVECEFCHATDPKTHKTNFALDTNPNKGTARIMIEMTNEINARYLSQVKDPDATPADRTVTCGTCHRGNSMPLPFAASGKDENHSGSENSGKNPD